ncbi:MAG: pyruvate formate lyase family protein [Syntrophobacteraceae bacterium]
MPQLTLTELLKEQCGMTERVSKLRAAYFTAVPEVCVERPLLLTRYHVENNLLDGDQISVLDKARAYRYVLQNRVPVVHHCKGFDSEMEPFSFKDRQLFAGSTTTKFKGVPLYPEFLSLTLWPELRTMPNRKSNPFHITEPEADALNAEVFPQWIENNIMELARKRSYAKNLEDFGVENSAPEMKLLQKLIFFLASKAECISHTIPDFSKAVGAGLRSVIDEAWQREAEAVDSSTAQFYAALREAMEGMIEYSRRLADEAERLAGEEADPVLKRELLDIAAINRHVPEFAARTFREGLTTVWICWTAVHLENPNIGLSLGRLDQLLYDLYRSDIDSGAITVADAVEMLCCFWLKIGDHVPAVPEVSEQLFGGTGSNQAITIGGVDSNGLDAVNDLTYVILRATELMKLRDPNLNARYYSGVNSKGYLLRLCEVNLNTGATPALHNDKAVIKALTAKGDTIEQARDYGVVGCVEPGSNGRTYAHTAAILFNLVSALELTLFNGRHRHTGLDVPVSIETGDSFTDFDEFKVAFEKQIRWVADRAVHLNELFGGVHQDFYPTPILSALFEGPMEKGKDLIRGGASINCSGATIIGLADVADSLSAIEKVVFKERALSFDQLLDALKKNFEGYEAHRLRLINPAKTPKYGNEEPAADANVAWVSKTLDKIFSEKTNYRGGKYRVGYWTMTNHAGFGRLMGALPNGRKAGENLASGITPVSGVTPELLKALHSVAKQSASCLSSGVALNLKYTPGDGPHMLKNFADTVEGYFDDANGAKDGGMEIQFNIVTHDTLVDAALHPENHSDLLVRVSGYTAYFKDLNPQMQKEIIDRTEYLLSTGRMVSFEPFPLPERR